MVDADFAPRDRQDDLVARRTLLAIAPQLEAGVRDWLAADPYGNISHLRTQVDRARAQEVMVILRSSQSSHICNDIVTLGTVVAPGIRASAHQARFIVHDAWKWFTELTHLHSAPTA